jgi:RNA polymerase sigma factor (sigma-70 family)
MPAAQPDDHFDHLSTSWTLLGNAHSPSAPAELRERARQQLLERYQALARRYLGGALRHEPDAQEAVAECLQELSVRIMAGALKHADPERGRFRYYLRTCLCNLVSDYRRRQGQRLGGLGDFDPAVPDTTASEQEFVALWRQDLVERALRALASHERRTGQQFYTVLKLKMDHPELRSAQMAERLSATLGRPLTETWVRKRLSLARAKLAELLRAEVKQSLRQPTEEQVDEELADLGLLEYCRPAGA